jgi:hypothetical protein
MPVNPSILSTTLQLLRDKLIDNSFVSHPLFRAIEQAGNLVKVSGGSRVEQPVIFGEHSSLSVLNNGFEPVNMAVTDPFNAAKFEWANFTQPIVLSAVEKAANKGDLAVVNILESKMKNVMLGLKKQVNQQVIIGTGAINTLQTLNGNGTTAVAPNTTGWFEGVAAATQSNTVGGLAKTTFRAQNWYNQFFNSGAAFDLSHLDQLMINAQLYHPGGKFPDIILMSPRCYAAFQAQQQSFVQYVSATDRASLDADMVGMWRGAKIYVDPNLGFTANAGSGMGALPVSAYVLSSDMFQLYADTDGWFNLSEMLPVPGTATEAAMVFCRMQLVTGHLASHGVLINAEA